MKKLITIAAVAAITVMMFAGTALAIGDRMFSASLDDPTGGNFRPTGYACLVAPDRVLNTTDDFVAGYAPRICSGETPKSYESRACRKSQKQGVNYTGTYMHGEGGVLIVKTCSTKFNGSYVYLMQKEGDSSFDRFMADQAMVNDALLQDRIQQKNYDAAVNNCVPEVSKWNEEVDACRAQYYVVARKTQDDHDQYSNKDMQEYSDAMTVVSACCGERITDSYGTCRANPTFTAATAKRPGGLLCKATNTVQEKVLDKTVGKLLDVLIGN